MQNIQQITIFWNGDNKEWLPTEYTSVYRKPTNTGLLLHFHSHVDRRYKTSLLRTMVDRAYRLSSTKELFEDDFF